jgi:hypothetical protein
MELLFEASKTDFFLWLKQKLGKNPTSTSKIVSDQYLRDLIIGRNNRLWIKLRWDFV